MRYGVLLSSMMLCAGLHAEWGVSSQTENRLAQLERSVAYFQNLQLTQQIHQLQNTIAELNGLLEEQAHRIESLEQTHQRQISSSYSGATHHSNKDDVQESTTVSATQPTAAITAASAKASVSNGAKEQAAATQEPVPDQHEAYRAALGLMQAKKYDQALVAFKQFLKDHTNSVYKPNVTYWLGEIQLLYGHTDLAQEAFAILVNQYPKHAKMPDALLKLAMLTQEHNPQEANKLFAKLDKDYPASSAAHLARVQRKKAQQKSNSQPSVTTRVNKS